MPETERNIDSADFQQFDENLKTGGAGYALDSLISRFREQKQYPLLFEALLMRKRHELGLPLVQVGGVGDVPDQARPAYEHAFIDAAREVGGLFLADGDIPRAWSYLRAIGEPAAVAEAIERVPPGENLDRIIEIAYQEGANPRKGFELLLSSYGICRAITFFSQYPGQQGREQSLELLVRTLHSELLQSLRRTIANNEAETPKTDDVTALIEGRNWLFEGCSYYVDTSHVVSILRYAIDLENPAALDQALQIAKYAERLDSMFHFRGDPPFDTYSDYRIYLEALTGQNIDGALSHFRQKAAEADPEFAGTIPAQILVNLLARLGRFDEAIDVSLRYLSGLDDSQSACLPITQLCQLAGEFTRLRQISREKSDLLHFAAGAIQAFKSAT